MSGEKSTTMIHECGRRVEVFEEGEEVSFVIGLVPRDFCPRCQRHLPSDWDEKNTRFWTTREWVKLSTWRTAIRGLGGRDGRQAA